MINSFKVKLLLKNKNSKAVKFQSKFWEIELELVSSISFLQKV